MLFKKLVTQSGNDTATSATWETGLTADGKTGISILGFQAYWTDGQSVAAGDWRLHAIINTLGVSETTPVSDDEIARVEWAVQNTGGVAVAIPLEPSKQFTLPEERVTVQPEIYLCVESSSTGQANDVIFVIQYDLVKLTDVEVLRLLAGGA
jgi:hypothetical protein